MAKKTFSDYIIKPESSPSESTSTPINKGKVSPIKIGKSTVKPGESVLENALEYLPGYGNFLSLDDEAIALEKVYSKPNWENIKGAIWETAGLIPFGKLFFDGVGYGAKLSGKANRAANYVDSAVGTKSDGELLNTEKKAYGGVVALKSRVKGGQLMHQIEVDDEIQQFDGGTGKDGVENPYLDYYVPVQGSAPADNIKAVQSIDKTKIVAPEKAKVMSDIKKEIRQRQDDQLIFERKKKIKEADEVQKKMSVIPGGKGWTKENMAKAVQAIPDKMRLFPDDPNSFFDEWLNVPKMIVGEGAKALGEAPLVAEQTGSVFPYVSAVAMPLITGRMLGASTFNPLKASTWTTENTTGNFINNIVNPLIPYETTKGAANVVKDAFVSNPARGTTSLLEGKNHPLYKIWKSSAKELGVEDWANEIGVESGAEVARVRKKKLEATFFAAGNRLANFTNTIPIVKDVQKELGKRIASQSSYPSRSVGEIKDAFTGLLKRDPIQNTYTGVLSPDYADPERNLLDNFIYQNDKGFTEYKGDIIKKGLDKYTKRHGDMKTYDLGLLYGGKDEPFSLHDITSGITLPEKVGIKQGLSQVGQSEYEKLALLKKYLKDSGETISVGTDRNLRSVNDNIAGHMRYLTYDKESDQVMGHVRDIWKFDPDDYTKWAEGVNADKYITEKQAGMLSTVGKPFLLYKKAPITVEGPIDQVPLFGPHDDFGKAVKVLGSDVSKKINVPEPLPFAYGGTVIKSKVKGGILYHQIEVDE